MNDPPSTPPNTTKRPRTPYTRCEQCQSKLKYLIRCVYQCPDDSCGMIYWVQRQYPGSTTRQRVDLSAGDGATRVAYRLASAYHMQDQTISRLLEYVRSLRMENASLRTRLAKATRVTVDD